MELQNELSLKTVDNYLSKIDATLSPAQKDFIFIFFQTNSLTTTKNYLNISLEEVVKFYKDPLIQDILRELQLERHRQIFKLKMLNLEELGSYLSNQILDLNLGEADRLNPREKLEAAKLLLEVHQKINNSIQNPIELNSYQILDMQFKDLSISTIKSLLHNDNNSNIKNSSLIADNSLNNSLDNYSNNNSININNSNNDVVDKVSKQKNLSLKNKKDEKLKNDVGKIKEATQN